MSIDVYPANPQVTATALIIFTGPPYVAVEWTLTGPGTIDAHSGYTNEVGQASAKFTPYAAGDLVVVSVRHGT